MKKMYKQPNVEAVEVQLNQNLLAGSGEPGISITPEPGTGIEGD